MTPARWKQIDTLVRAALGRGDDDRAAFLEEACGGDDALRREVESEIGYQQQASQFLEEPAFKLAAELILDTEAETESMEGRTISHYSIQRKLGRGGMGEVYLAQDTMLSRKVAVKFLLQNSDGSGEQARKRFVREARAAAALDHPHICAVYEVGEESGHSFIVMQYVEGETLASRIQRQPFELREAVDIAAQIADALAEAHSHGIIHRDIKPQNMMLTARGQAKVLDFGLARVVHKGSLIDSISKTESFLSVPGLVIGTVPYMSPEQVRGEELDARSDIFSFGAVLYEMISGIDPFRAETAGATMASILTKDPAPLERYVSRVPDELQRIIRKALSKDKEGRYQAIKDLLIDLRDLKQTMEVEARLERSVRDGAAAVGRAEVAAAAEAPTLPLDPVRTDGVAGKLTIQQNDRTRRSRLAIGLLVTLVIAVAVFLGYRAFTADAGKQLESIAVLPFLNESGNPDVEYLSDGMTESLINSLSQLPGLSVKARSSVYRYKGKEVEPQEVASALSVQGVLSARFVQRGADLTLYLSLVDGRNGDHLWGEHYNLKLTDLVALQSQFTRDVSRKLRARLSGADEQKLAKNYTANAEAYQLYLKGRYHVLKQTRSEIQTGISFFQQAIAIDSSYALAHTGIAEGYWRLSFAGEMLATEVVPKAKAAVQKAIEIDPALAEAHAILGNIAFWYEWDWNAAENHFKRALELSPDSADAHSAYANFLAKLGRFAEALAEIKHAIELDPTSLQNKLTEGNVLYFAGRYDEALAKFQKAIELNPSFWQAHSLASTVYIEKGMFDEAVDAARKARQPSDTNTNPVAFLCIALAKSGKRGEARAELEKLLKLSTERYVSPYSIAMIYEGLGESKEALAWLERGYEQRHVRMPFLNHGPRWKNLRDDPRFQDLVRRVGIPGDLGDR